MKIYLYWIIFHLLLFEYFQLSLLQFAFNNCNNNNSNRVSFSEYIYYLKSRQEQEHEEGVEY